MAASRGTTVCARGGCSATPADTLYHRATRPEERAVPPIDLAGLDLQQRAALLSGRDFWSTPPVPEAGLPAVVLTDGPHGVRRQAADFGEMGLFENLPATCFPPAVAVGSSWDPEVAERLGAAVGREARAL